MILRQLMPKGRADPWHMPSIIAYESLAFPCISTGVYGYPKAQACEVAVSAVVEWLATHDRPRVVTFCCFGPDDVALYSARLESAG
jgi:O-acetyl-ADP-ribose deacetylase (regulator of RNase III)